MNSLPGILQRNSSALLRLAIAAGVLLLAFIFGSQASSLWLGLLMSGVAGLTLLQIPVLGILALVLAALVVPMEFSTGTAVLLNPVSLLVPVMLGVWFLDMLRRQDFRLAPSRTTVPLALFLLANLFSLLIGIVWWDPSVPRTDNFMLVQVAQWVLFVLCAGTFWLSGNLIRDIVWLKRLTFLFLAVAGSLAVLLVLPQIGVLTSILAPRVALANIITTQALHRAPFWMILTALAGGQLLFNKDLSPGWRVFLLVALGAVGIYAFDLMRKTASNWVGVAAAASVLAWLRFPRLRWPVVILLLVLAGTGILSSTVYSFAGGDDEWNSSGGSRLVLIARVVEVTLRNPLTGLGPAAYRIYAQMKPLPYGRAFWVQPSVSSHNNYVDLFSHGGILGLGLFLWFLAEVAKLAAYLRGRFTHGFSAGYVNAMLAAGAGSIILMLFVDWILPFVYNVGFPGFQASMLVWLFLGGLVALEQTAKSEPAT